MSYQEHNIQFEDLQKYITRLDSDEGIRIDNLDDKIFVNKIANRYIILVSKNGNDEFFYFYEPVDVLNFLKNNTKSQSKIFSY